MHTYECREIGAPTWATSRGMFWDRTKAEAQLRKLEALHGPNTFEVIVWSRVGPRGGITRATEKCPYCNGGEVYNGLRRSGYYDSPAYIACAVCHGSGTLNVR